MRLASRSKAHFIYELNCRFHNVAPVMCCSMFVTHCYAAYKKVQIFTLLLLMPKVTFFSLGGEGCWGREGSVSIYCIRARSWADKLGNL